ncbi:hypothetical protein [Desulfococcus sp.]|uniref:hypothetical protein n=1 Tax=Desulfococcus sp. TaxID=2025834 RepID=UPI0035933ABD
MTKPNKMESKKDILLHAMELTKAASRGGHPVKPELILEGVYRKLLELYEEVNEPAK